MAKSAVSTSNRRALEAIMNCSVQLYSTRSMLNGDGADWDKVDGACQKRTTSSLTYVSDGSYLSYACSSGVKRSAKHVIKDRRKGGR